MKRIRIGHLLFISFVFLFTNGFSQENAVRPYPMTEKGLLWQIQGPKVKGKCYLFGTMHLIPEESFYFHRKLEKALVKSKQLVMEIADIPNQSEATRMMMLTEGSLLDFFEENQLDSLYNWSESKLGVDSASFNLAFSGLKPIAVIQIATQLNFGSELASYELTFEKIARENELLIVGLETLAEQMSLFDDLEKNEQAELVMESIADNSESVLATNELLRLYASQDVDSLYQLISEEEGVISNHQAKFLDDRNILWIPKIKSMVSTMKTFIAVGAGHLGGPNGLIRLLEKEGYTLTPIVL